MPRYGCCVQIGPVHIDSPEFLDAVKGIRDGVEVLGKASRCHQMVDLAVICNDFGNGPVDRILVGDVGIVGGYLGDTACLSGWTVKKGIERLLLGPRVLRQEVVHEQFGLSGSFILWVM